MIAKRLFRGVDLKKLSAVPPDKYQRRFVNFTKDVVFVDQSQFEKRNFSLEFGTKDLSI
jgi:hypothetical protein